MQPTAALRALPRTACTLGIFQSIPDCNYPVGSAATWYRLHAIYSLCIVFWSAQNTNGDANNNARAATMASSDECARGPSRANSGMLRHCACFKLRVAVDMSLELCCFVKSSLLITQQITLLLELRTCFAADAQTGYLRRCWQARCSRTSITWSGCACTSSWSAKIAVRSTLRMCLLPRLHITRVLYQQSTHPSTHSQSTQSRSSSPPKLMINLPDVTSAISGSWTTPKKS